MRCLTTAKPAQTVLLLLLFVINFTQGIYRYVPETRHVPTVYNAAAVLRLLLMLHFMLFPMIYILHFHISTSRSMCAVPSMFFFVVLGCCASRVCCLGYYYYQ